MQIYEKFASEQCASMVRRVARDAEVILSLRKVTKNFWRYDLILVILLKIVGFYSLHS